MEASEIRDGAGHDVSVVIPTYNTSRFIEETLESIFAQSHLPREIVIVDDRSTDNTVEKVRSIARRAPVPIRLLILNRNSGSPAIPTNTGIRAAHTGLIALLDHDDVMAPRKLEMQREALIDHPEIDIVFSDYYHFSESGILENLDARSQYPHTYSQMITRPGEANLLTQESCLQAFFTSTGLPLSCSGLCFRKQLWQELGGFSRDKALSPYYDFTMRAIRGPVAWIDVPLFGKRTHENNLWQPTTENMFANARTRWQIYMAHRRNTVMRKAVVRRLEDWTFRLRESGRIPELILTFWMLCRAGAVAIALREAAKMCATPLRPLVDHGLILHTNARNGQMEVPDHRA